nr:hypothetical protein [Tanacetum cinerariifolium]
MGKNVDAGIVGKSNEVVKEKRKIEFLKDKLKDEAASVDKDTVSADATHKVPAVDVVKDKAPDVVKEIFFMRINQRRNNGGRRIDGGTMADPQWINVRSMVIWWIEEDDDSMVIYSAVVIIFPVMVCGVSGEPLDEDEINGPDMFFCSLNR